MTLTIQVTVSVGSKTCTHELKLRHVITTDMHIGIFPLEDEVAIVIGIWNFNNESKMIWSYVCVVEWGTL